ncbi:YdeI family protein [Salinibacterium sp. SWN248]|uniref:YdeI/OmpD-associated family protein n=1 Tax=Salinibacterium sp. SWN248 TaxID=2792056 RepID=UPI001E3A0B34|nr:YdeI/OmpD-associated family protein [Salinibacterium sp. SWN248]
MLERGAPKEDQTVASFVDKTILDVTIAEWTAYLESEPSLEGVRLKLRKKLSKATGITWSEALDVALCFGWIDGQMARLDDDYTLQAFTPRRKNSPWSQVNRDHVARLIEEGTMRPGGLAEVERAQADGRWDAAYSQKNMTTPPDLQAALDANPASAAFHASLTRSMRFQIYARLTGIKTPAVRAARIRDVVEKGAVGEHHYAAPKPRP